MRIPIYHNFLATSYLKAFILNALVISLISGAAMVTHESLIRENGTLNKFFYNMLYDGNKSYILRFETKIIINFIVTFVSVLCVLMILYVLIGFGGGMITPLEGNTARKQIRFSDLFS